MPAFPRKQVCAEARVRIVLRAERCGKNQGRHETIFARRFPPRKIGARMLREALIETIWPTRCSVCDRPGAVLCDACLRNLEYIDACKSCPVCGSPFGLIQCTDCAAAALEDGHLPLYCACMSLTRYEGGAARIVRTYKDGGERRLHAHIAQLLARAVPRSWISDADAVCAVPASREAYAKRGFDHMGPVAGEFGRITGLAVISPLSALGAADQRALGRKGRRRNMKHAFRIRSPDADGLSLLLIDDVYTTGATLDAASRALISAGALKVRCLTFARA